MGRKGFLQFVQTVLGISILHDDQDECDKDEYDEQQQQHQQHWIKIQCMEQALIQRLIQGFLQLMLGFPKICEWRRLGSTRVSQSRAIGQTWTKPETPGLTRPWWNSGHGRMTQTRSHAQHHGGSTNDSQVQVSPKAKTKIGSQS